MHASCLFSITSRASCRCETSQRRHEVPVPRVGHWILAQVAVDCHTPPQTNGLFMIKRLSCRLNALKYFRSSQHEVGAIGLHSELKFELECLQSRINCRNAVRQRNAVCLVRLTLSASTKFLRQQRSDAMTRCATCQREGAPGRVDTRSQKSESCGGSMYSPPKKLRRGARMGRACRQYARVMLQSGETGWFAKWLVWCED